MNIAVATLDCAVRDLFTPSTVFAVSLPHPLCECILYQSPPPKWRYLHRFPVLKRHVLRQFRSMALERKKIPQTPRKRKKRSVDQQKHDMIEYKALCLALLCQRLAQCELLTLNDAELFEMLVNLESLEVLRYVISKRMLPLRLRMLLLSFALQNQQEKCLEAAVQSWIQQVCEKLLEEIPEASATRQISEPPLKCMKTRSSEKVEREIDKDKCCGFCRDVTINAEALRSNIGGWEFLIECTQKTAQMLEKAGESYTTNQAIVALSALWEALLVAGFTASVKTGQRRKRPEMLVTIGNDCELLISVAAYKKICQRAAESSAGKTNAFQKLWTDVWDREFKYIAQVKQITLADTIRHCSTVDAFASMVLSIEQKKQASDLPGFCAMMVVIQSLSAGLSEIVTAFAHVWTGMYCGTFSSVPIPFRKRIWSTKLVLQSYLSELLKSPSARHAAAPRSVNKSLESRKVAPLRLLFYLYELYLPVPYEQQDSSCFKHWDALMSHLNSDTVPTGSARDGIAWCLLLKKCVLDVSAEALLRIRCDSNFVSAFQRYCHAIMYEIIVSGGEVISSGGTMRWLLICEKNDHKTIRQILVQMMTIFSEDWITQLIAQLLRANASVRSTGEFTLQGIRTLFFPAFVLYMKLSNWTDVDKQKTGQQQFAAFVHSVNVLLNQSEPTALYLVSLIRFCEAWDVYRRSCHTKEASTTVDRWGFRAMIELDVLPELLYCYSNDTLIRQETSEALMFATEVLQNTPNCPPSLEASLFKVLSTIKGHAVQGKSITSSVLPAIDEVLVSHSSDALQRLLCAVRFAGVTQTRQLVSQFRDNVGTLVELRKQLEQWFSFVEMNGTAFVGKESRLELSLLCARLIRWFPNEFENMRYLLMTPLDSHLVFALKAFVKKAGRLSNQARQSVLSSTVMPSLQSAIQVEMALHSYLTAAAFPDLETLTVLLTKAIIKCHSPDAFDHLTNVARKIGRTLLPEAAIAAPSFPLKGLEFFSSVLTQHDEDGDDEERFRNYSRRAKSVIYQENTLKLLAESPSIFAGGLSWSTLLFGERSAATWLPHLFEYILKTDFSEGMLRADMLFKSLDDLVQQAGCGEKALQEAYWLASLLNTALIACSSRSAGSCAALEEGIWSRLRQVVKNVLQLLLLPSNTTATTWNKNDTTSQLTAILGLRNMSMVARLVIKEDSVDWLYERFVGTKVDGALQMILSAAWNGEMKGSQVMTMQPTVQLFLPFSSWLPGALVYSQSFLEEPSAAMRRWERTFTSYVIDLYLHLEFEDVTCDLLRAWLTTWISCNIERGQDDVQLLALLPSQVALFRRLGLAPYRNLSRGQIQDSTSIWQLIFVTIDFVVDTSRDPVATEKAIQLVASTLTTLELVELSLSSDFMSFSHVQDTDVFFQELDTFLSRSQLRVCGIAQVFCLLQYPLEIVVCCYVCKIPTELIAESQQFLQCVDKVLRYNFGIAKGIEEDDTTESTLQDSLHAKDRGSLRKTLDHPPFTADSTDMEAFLQYWEDEMLLKYDYLDRERCTCVLKVIHAAMVHSTATK